MTIDTDYSVSASGDIRYEGAGHGVAGAGYYPVIELHRWLQSLAYADESSGDDILDITKTTPSERLGTDNLIQLNAPYNLDDTAVEHLYDGSIIQDGGDTIYDGIVNYGTEGIHIEIVQDGALIANDFWNSIPDGETEKGLNRDISAGISHRFLVKVRDSGADIDGRRLLGLNREFGKSYGEFFINGSIRGNNTLSLSHDDDLNNQTAEATVATWTTIDNNKEGYSAIDVDGDTTDEYYYGEWDKDIYEMNQFYERMKWLTRRGTSETLYGIDAGIFRGITHEINITPGTGTWVEPESVSWATGTGQLLAVDDTDATATTKMWIQVLTGVAPVNSQAITGNGGATGTCNGAPTERAVAKPFCGASTGSAIVGAYGFGIEVLDLTAADKLKDLTNTQRIPLNNVTYSVTGVVASEDYVLVGPRSGSALDEEQLSADGAYAGGETTVTVKEDIPSDTKSSGTIRMWNGSSYNKVPYTAWSGKSFTGCSNVPACSDGDNIWISYIDKLATSTEESFVVPYSANPDLFVRVRDAGGTPTKTFESALAVLTSTGGSTPVTRISDA